MCLFWFSQLLHLHVEKAKFLSLYLHFQIFFSITLLHSIVFLEGGILEWAFLSQFWFVYVVRFEAMFFILFYFIFWGGWSYKKGVWKFIFVNNSLLYVYFTPFSAFGFNFLWLFSVTPLLWTELITECHWKNIKIHGCYPC